MSLLRGGEFSMFLLMCTLAKQLVKIQKYFYSSFTFALENFVLLVAFVGLYFPNVSILYRRVRNKTLITK